MIGHKQWKLKLLSVMLVGVSCFAPNAQTKPFHRFQLRGRTFSHSPVLLSSATSNIDPGETQEEALLRELEEDLAALSYLRPSRPSADESRPAAIVSAGSSYTRIWTKETWNIHSNPPHHRYLRHLWKWRKSSTARIIMPSVIFAGCWAVLVSILAEHLQGGPVRTVLKVAGTTSAFSLLSAPLALLLTLRANASMARLMEARQAWGRLVLHARGLSSILGIYVFPYSPEAAVLAIRHLALVGWILKARMRGEDEQSQLDVLRTMLGNTTDYQWMKSQSKRTVALTTRIRQICAVAVSNLGKRRYTSATHLIIEERIGELEAVVGVCERLFGSPIPPTYTRHLSRVMSLWILLMPMSLISAGLSTVGVAFATATAAYVFIGLDEVGMEIENVFQLLPLQQLAAATQNDVREQFIARPPKISVNP